MPIYAKTIPAYVTVYVRAADKDEADLLLNRAGSGEPYAEIRLSGGDIPVSGLKFIDPKLPDVSISPAGTVHLEQAAVHPWEEME